MGEAAEMILDGLLCQECSSLIDGDAPGYPRVCAFCRGTGRVRRDKPRKRMTRPTSDGKPRSDEKEQGA
jgi:hypothetical protein